VPSRKIVVSTSLVTNLPSGRFDSGDFAFNSIRTRRSFSADFSNTVRSSSVVGDSPAEASVGMAKIAATKTQCVFLMICSWHSDDQFIDNDAAAATDTISIAPLTGKMYCPALTVSKRNDARGPSLFG
jgi:hypothetical protein